MLTPFMSCSAKIPIYALFAAAFFPKYSALFMICMYLLGIIVGIIASLILSKTVYRGKPVPFVMELPNYRLPTPQNTLHLMWDKAKDFLQRAFSVIFVASIVIWFLRSFDTRLNFVDNSEASLLAVVGGWIAPIFKPLGFGDWKMSTALITGVMAKEAVVSTLGILVSTGEEALAGFLPAFMSTPAALSFVTFTLLYTPCIAAVAAIRREFGGSVWKTVGIVAAQCAVAWVTAFLVYLVSGLLV